MSRIRGLKVSVIRLCSQFLLHRIGAVFQVSKTYCEHKLEAKAPELAKRLRMPKTLHGSPESIRFDSTMVYACPSFFDAGPNLVARLDAE